MRLCAFTLLLLSFLIENDADQFSIRGQRLSQVLKSDNEAEQTVQNVLHPKGLQFGSPPLLKKAEHHLIVPTHHANANETDKYSTRATYFTKYPTLANCDDIQERYNEISKKMRDLTKDLPYFSEPIVVAMTLSQMLNPSQWGEELFDSFKNFLNLKKPSLYSIEGLDTFCDDLLTNSYGPLAKCAAGFFSGTITMAFEAAVTIAGATGSLGIDVSWGENGESSCSLLRGGGFLEHTKGWATGVAGFDLSASIDYMPSLWGGFKNVGSDHRKKGKVVTTSISVGVGGDVGIVLVSDLNEIDEDGLAVKINDGIQDFLSNNKLIEFLLDHGVIMVLQFLCNILKNIIGGIVGFGIFASLGVDVLDYITSSIGDPDFSHVFGSELLITCSAKTDICKGKPTVKTLKHGDACQMLVDCFLCDQIATPWYGHEDSFNPTQLRCGDQPCWGDKTACNQHPWNSCDPSESWNLDNKIYFKSGQTCCNDATFWYGKEWLPITAPSNNGNRCGSQPKWPDGTACGQLATNNCKACANTATYWYGAQWLPTGKRCGSQPGWPDGTPCGNLPNNSCSACKNTAYAWYGSEYLPIGKRCGKQKCWRRGTGCGTPNSPCDKACCKYRSSIWNWTCD